MNDMCGRTVWAVTCCFLGVQFVSFVFGQSSVSFVSGQPARESHPVGKPNLRHVRRHLTQLQLTSSAVRTTMRMKWAILPALLVCEATAFFLPAITQGLSPRSNFLVERCEFRHICAGVENDGEKVSPCSLLLWAARRVGRAEG